MKVRVMQVRVILAALVAAPVALAQPVSAQNTTGTVNLTGSVAPRCGVAGSGSGSIFGQTVALGELAAADGTLRTGIESQFANAVAAISVVCNTVAPTISVSATALSAQTSTNAPPTGYANSIAYTATVSLGTTGSVPALLSAVSGTSTSRALSSGEGRVANSAGNLVLTATAFHTASPTQILVADSSYKGSIAITIAPGT